ncbi:MAG: helix-turn-helix domain-containing protein [Mycobacterium sp.]
MLASTVEFAPGTGTRAEVVSIGRTSLHAHPGVLEIVYVLRGGLHAQVSFEQFDLVSGDFIVINEGDPHQLVGGEANVTALVHLDLATFEHIDPFVGDVIFACESFDLVRYRGQESRLRRILLDLVADLLNEPGVQQDSMTGTSQDLVRTLCSSYSLENYYHRDREPTAAQRALFHTVVRHLSAHAVERDVLGQLAAQLHYSKSRLSHLVKEVSGISFRDLLTFVRVNHGERLLLDSDATMVEVSAACGFSDVKYFTRAFADWFHHQPAEYRRKLRPEMSIPGDIDRMTAVAATQLIDEHRRELTRTAGAPRLSITPLLLKNVGSRLDLYESVRTATQQTTAPPRQTIKQRHVRHLVPIELDLTAINKRSLLYALQSIDQSDATACLVLQFSTQAAMCAELAQLRRHLGTWDTTAPAIWLIYGEVGDRRAVDAVVDYAAGTLGFSVQPILRT